MSRDPDSLPPRDVDPHPIARWGGALLCLVYGLSKMVGAQFLVLDSMLSRPMASVPGFWLTWYYFGASTPYKVLITGAEVLAGVLLVFPRTALLGALLLLPIAANILAVDLFFGVDLGGTLMAAILLGFALAIVLPERRRLLQVILRPGSDGNDRWRGAALAVLLIGSTWIARWGRDQAEGITAIDGTWAVVRTGGVPSTWDRIFFERERAEMAVFRDTVGTDAIDRFRIDSIGRIEVWQDYYASEDPRPLGPRLWVGERDGADRITLRGDGPHRGDTLFLRKIGEPGHPTPEHWQSIFAPGH